MVIHDRQLGSAAIEEGDTTSGATSSFHEDAPNGPSIVAWESFANVGGRCSGEG